MYIYVFIKNRTIDVRFLAFSLARRGHRLSVLISALPNIVKERVSIKARRKHLCSSEKKRPTKAVLDRNKIDMVGL